MPPALSCLVLSCLARLVFSTHNSLSLSSSSLLLPWRSRIRVPTPSVLLRLLLHAFLPHIPHHTTPPTRTPSFTWREDNNTTQDNTTEYLNNSTVVDYYNNNFYCPEKRKIERFLLTKVGPGLIQRTAQAQAVHLPSTPC